MKYLSLILIALSFCLTACNNNDEPVINGFIPIHQDFLPGSVIFEVNDTEFRDKIKGWNNEKVIVNSIEELPNDPLGFTESYSKINFSDQTLLLYYQTHSYDIVSYSSSMIKNNQEQLYDWVIRLGTGGDINFGDDLERLVFTRYAILIPKTPVTTSDLRVVFSVFDLNWDK